MQVGPVEAAVFGRGVVVLQVLPEKLRTEEGGWQEAGPTLKQERTHERGATIRRKVFPLRTVHCTQTELQARPPQEWMEHKHTHAAGPTH